MLPAPIARPFRRYADFRGRSTRREYWTFAAVALATLLATVVAAAAIASVLRVDPDDARVVTPCLPVALALLVPGLAVKVRRVHDIGLSGWWLLVTIVPLVGALVDLLFALKPGDAGPNRFGADPRERVASV